MVSRLAALANVTDALVAQEGQVGRRAVGDVPTARPTPALGLGAKVVTPTLEETPA